MDQNSPRQILFPVILAAAAAATAYLAARATQPLPGPDPLEFELIRKKVGVMDEIMDRQTRRLNMLHEAVYPTELAEIEAGRPEQPSVFELGEASPLDLFPPEVWVHVPSRENLAKHLIKWRAEDPYGEAWRIWQDDARREAWIRVCELEALNHWLQGYEAREDARYADGGVSASVPLYEESAPVRRFIAELPIDQVLITEAMQESTDRSYGRHIDNEHSRTGTSLGMGPTMHQVSLALTREIQSLRFEHLTPLEDKR